MEFTYRVTYEDYKPMTVDAYSKTEAVKIAKEILKSWGYKAKGKAKAEAMNR